MKTREEIVIENLKKILAELEVLKAQPQTPNRDFKIRMLKIELNSSY